MLEYRKSPCFVQSACWHVPADHLPHSILLPWKCPALQHVVHHPATALGIITAEHPALLLCTEDPHCLGQEYVNDSSEPFVTAAKLRHLYNLAIVC